MEVTPNQLMQAIKSRHGGTPVLVEAVPVQTVVEGKTVWEGVAHVFDLDDHPRATRAYAWSSSVEDSRQRRFFAVLHLGPIRSPLDAVRAAMVAEALSK